MAKKRHYDSDRVATKTLKYGPHDAETNGERTYGAPNGKRTRMMQPDSEYTAEYKSAGMIGNDYNKFANLPTEVMMKEYPACPAYMDWEMEDNIRGIDRQLANDNARRRAGFDPHKY